MCTHSPGEIDSDWSPAVLDKASDIPYSSTVVYHNSICDYICDRACENQPCERKLHRVIFLPISSALNVVSRFCKFQKLVH